MATDIYVDLDVTGGTGSSGDPFGYDTFQTDATRNTNTANRTATQFYGSFGRTATQFYYDEEEETYYIYLTNTSGIEVDDLIVVPSTPEGNEGTYTIIGVESDRVQIEGFEAPETYTVAVVINHSDGSFIYLTDTSRISNGSVVTVTGTAHNNGTHTVDDVQSDKVHVTSTLTDETITVSVSVTVTGEDSRYYIKGKHTYAGDIIFSGIRNTITLDAWLDTPPTFKNSKLQFYAEKVVGDINVNRIIYGKSGSTTIDFSRNTAISTPRTLNITNCFLVATDGPIVQAGGHPSGGGLTVNVKGSSLISLKTSDSAEFFGSNNEIITLIIDSCYLDGKVSIYCRKLGGGGQGFSGSSQMRYTGMYNNSVYSGIGITDGGNNVFGAASPTQLQWSAPKQVDLLTLPGDIEPLAASAIRDAGNPALGLVYDIMNVARSYGQPDIGAAEYVLSAINTFNVTPERNGVLVVSTINADVLIAKIQADNPDVYFDEASEFNRVYITYQHIDGRQKKMIIHSGLTGIVSWSTFAKSGVWQKIRIKAIDNDGAEHILNRTAIGTSEDLTLV